MLHHLELAEGEELALVGTAVPRASVVEDDPGSRFVGADHGGYPSGAAKLAARVGNF